MTNKSRKGFRPKPQKTPNIVHIGAYRGINIYISGTEFQAKEVYDAFTLGLKSIDTLAQLDEEIRQDQAIETEDPLPSNKTNDSITKTKRAKKNPRLES